MPIEQRALFIKESKSAQGAITCWLDILTPKEAKSILPMNIEPLPRIEFEIRLIVW